MPFQAFNLDYEISRSASAYAVSVEIYKAAETLPVLDSVSWLICHQGGARMTWCTRFTTSPTQSPDCSAALQKSVRPPDYLWPWITSQQ
jgi:hypothetical protein